MRPAQHREMTAISAWGKWNPYLPWEGTRILLCSPSRRTLVSPSLSPYSRNQRRPARSGCRHRRIWRSYMPIWACPHTDQAIRRRRMRTVTTAASPVSFTLVTLAPEAASRRSIPW